MSMSPLSEPTSMLGQSIATALTFFSVMKFRPCPLISLDYFSYNYPFH